MAPACIDYVITTLRVGGAQETVLASCGGLDRARYSVTLVAGCEDDPEVLVRAQALRIPVVRVSALYRQVRPIDDVRALVQLCRRFRRERPLIVHTHSSKAGLLGRVAARITRIPLVVHTVHGWSFHQGQRPAVRAAVATAERVLARWTDAIVVVTEVDRDIGMRHVTDRIDRYELIRSAIDLSEFRPADAAHRDRARRAVGASCPFVVGTVTRLAPQKDPVTLVRTFAKFAGAVDDAELIVIGDGPDRARIEDECAALGVADRVRLVGRRAEVAALMPAFDVFVSTSRWEGLPRAVVEAMAAGVPVVATDVGGVGELVDDQLTGLLVPPEDSSAIAAALRRVYDDRPAAAAMATRARQAVGQFATEEMLRGLDALYQRLLATSPRAANRAEAS